MKPRPIFGVPELDALLQDRTPESTTQNSQAVAITCIEGQAGTGKSTLALNAAAAHARHGGVVFYISTDWGHQQARDLWDAYDLGNSGRYAGPASHRQETVVTDRANNSEFKRLSVGESASDSSLTMVLAELSMPQWGNISGTIPAHRHSGRMFFIDLSTEDLGDEWAFAERLLGALTPSSAGPSAMNLIVIDSLPGLEVLSGEFDSYGDRVPSEVHLGRFIRLARAAGFNLMYTASMEAAAVNAHETQQRNSRAEAQADFVYQLTLDQRYNGIRRKIQVVKTRGFDAGLEPCYIEFRSRDATLSWAKPDRDRNAAENHHLYVFPSLNVLMDSIKKLKRNPPPKDSGSVPVCATGIQYLDNLLFKADAPSNLEIHPTSTLGDRFGVPVGSILRVTGDPHTNKSQVGIAFARYSFARLGRQVMAILPAFFEDYLTDDALGKLKAGKDVLDPLPLRDDNSWARYRAEVLGELAVSGLIKLPDEWGPWKIHIWESLCERARPSAGSVPGGVVPKGIAERFRSAFGFVNKPGVIRSALIITAKSMNHQDFAEATADFFTHRLEPFLRSLWYCVKEQYRGDFDNFKKAFHSAYQEVVLQHVEIRRIVGTESAPSVFIDVVRRNIELLRLKMTVPSVGEALPNWLHPMELDKSVRLRVVIDDLHAIREASTRAGQPSEYALLLSTLTTYLSATRACACIVETLGASDQGPLLGSLSQPESMVTVHASRVTIENGSRVAITIQPATRDENHAIVREFKLTDLPSPGPRRAGRARFPVVDPDFELYQDFGSGNPQLVGLRVMLYQETKAWDRYYEETNQFLGRVMMASLDSARADIVVPVRPSDYSTLKDLATFPNSASLPSTLVLQVDGFWGLRRPSDLRDVEEYMDRQLDSGIEYERIKEDQYFSFAPTVGSPLRSHSEGASLSAKRSRGGHFAWTLRRNGKDEFVYRPHFPMGPDNGDTPVRIDRVPFTWDFGFMLVNSSLAESQQHSQPVSWETCFQRLIACAEAEGRRTGSPVLPFRLAATEPDTLDSLVLEIWFSSLAEQHDTPEFLHWVSCDALCVSDIATCEELKDGIISLLAPNAKGLQTVEKLWKTIEWLSFSMLGRIGENLHRVDQAGLDSVNYVAARHWYKTAACETNPSLGAQRGDRTYSVDRLPGHFSVRGDWYLGVAKGSRSIRLGELALDALVGVRQNVQRLQQGIGLPVRGIGIDPNSGQSVDGYDMHYFETALHARINAPSSGDARGPLRLGEFLHTCCPVKSIPVTPVDGKMAKDDLRWLWRSAIGGYDWQAKPFTEWLRRMVTWHQTLFLDGDLKKPSQPVSDVVLQRIEARRENEIRMLRAWLSAATPIKS